MTDSWDRAVWTVLAPAYDLQPTDEEIARVLELDRQRGARRQARVRRIAVSAAVVAAVSAGAYAVPTTRAAIGDAYGAIAPWVDANHDDQAPGRSLTVADDAPDWVRHAPGSKRVVAETAGVKLIVVRDGHDKLSVALGDSVGLTSTVEEWQQLFSDQPIIVLGPASFPGGPLDEQGRRPLLGLVAKPVTRIELRYASGERTSEDGLDGGFVLLADAAERPRSLVAFDAAGREVDRLDVSSLDLRICMDVRGCPPGHLSP
jgi:hypothetical protein